MKYTQLKLDDRITVTHNGARAIAKVRRIGPVQGQGWAMLTLDVAGEVLFMPAAARELAEPVMAGQGGR